MGTMCDVEIGTQEFAERASVLSYGPRHILLALLLGIPLAVLSALVLFVLVTDPASLSSNDKKLASLCLVLFAAMLWVLYRVIRKGLRGMRRSRLLKQYLDLIVNKGNLALDDLVILTGRSMDAVVEDVGDMIRLGFLPEHKIDSTAHILSLEPISKLLEQDAQVRKPHEAEETGWVVFPANEEPTLPLNPGGASNAHRTGVQLASAIAFTCRSCGANNSVRVACEDSARCDYCGSARFAH